MSAGLYGVGSALPGRPISNADLEARLDTSDEWIVRRTGIRQRHHLNGAESLGDLAVRAAEAALADAGRSGSEVDHVLVATITADRVTPGLAPEVAERIGAGLAGAADLNAACAGFLYALDQAAALIDSGRADVVLVCGADALSRITDHGDRSTAVLFGDGAGAVVVARGDHAIGCPPFELRCDGTGAGQLYADRDERKLRMEGQEVYRHAVRRMAEATRVALARAGLEPRDLDCFVAHQANARIVEAAARDLGLPADRVLLNIHEVGNTSSASIPLLLDRAQRDGQLGHGATVGLAAFGAGYVWGAGIVSWKERVHVCA